MGPAVEGSNGRRRLYAATVVALLGVFALQLWLHATRTSAVFDEPPHILAGYRYWQCGDFGINPEHPPFLKLLAALPLLAKELRQQPAWPCGSRLTPKLDSFQAGNEFVAGNGAAATLVPARLAAASLSLALALLVFLAAREMFGPWEGLVAMALLVFEPNLVAHGALVTTDMAVTATLFASVYALYRFRMRPTAWRFLLAGLATGLTLASKFSGVVVLFLLPTVDLLLSRNVDGRDAPVEPLLRRAAAIAGIIAIGFIVVWATYGFRHAALPATPAGVAALAPARSVGPPAARLVSVAGDAGLIPEAYAAGFVAMIARSQSEPMFLLGTMYPAGQWFYFPVAFAIKTSATLLVLLAVSAASARLLRERRREVLCLVVPAFVFFAVALTSRLNIGIRHILPIYPFLIVIAAAAACARARRWKAARGALIALLGVHAATACAVVPNDLAFSNVFWGGTASTYRWLSDSNVDWGQNLKLAREYVERDKVAHCWLAPFGNGTLVREALPCRLLPGAWDWDAADPVEAVPPVIDGTVLLSAINLPPTGGKDYLPLAASRPVDVIGGGILVYRGRFELPLVAAMSHVERARQLLAGGHRTEAIAEARAATALAPDDLRAHLALGVALARGGQAADAWREIKAAAALCKARAPLFTPDDILARDEVSRLLAEARLDMAE